MTKTSKYYRGPPNSPDLNPTEPLRESLDCHVGSVDRPQHPLQQLWDALQSAWLQILVTTYQDLTESLPARLAAVCLQPLKFKPKVAKQAD